MLTKEHVEKNLKIFQNQDLYLVVYIFCICSSKNGLKLLLAIVPQVSNVAPGFLFSFLDIYSYSFFSYRCNAVFIVFYFIGIGSLLPWNFFITANKVDKSAIFLLHGLISGTSVVCYFEHSTKTWREYMRTLEYL